jgi:hypothetical protein
MRFGNLMGISVLGKAQNHKNSKPGKLKNMKIKNKK